MQRAESEDVIRGSTVTDHALGSAGIVPGLAAPRTGRILIRIEHREIVVLARCRNQFRFGLLVIPSIAITDPLALLTREQPGFDPAMVRGMTRLAIKGKRLDQHGPLGKVPAARRGKVDLRRLAGLRGNGDVTILRGAIRPERRVH